MRSGVESLDLTHMSRLSAPEHDASRRRTRVVRRSCATLLFGVEPADPVTFASVVAVLTVTAAIATAAPALRAVRVDSAVTFRNE